MAEDETPNQDGIEGGESPGAEDAAQAADTGAADDQMADAGDPPAEIQDDGADGFDDAATEDGNPGISQNLTAVYDIPVQVSAVLGKASMPVSQLLKLGRGAVVELDRKVGEAIDIYVNNRLVARGEIVVVDERLGVTMTEIVKSDRS